MVERKTALPSVILGPLPWGEGGESSEPGEGSGGRSVTGRRSVPARYTSLMRISTARVRELRRNQTEAEKAAWHLLRDRHLGHARSVGPAPANGVAYIPKRRMRHRPTLCANTTMTEKDGIGAGVMGMVLAHGVRAAPSARIWLKLLPRRGMYA